MRERGSQHFRSRACVCLFWVSILEEVITNYKSESADTTMKIETVEVEEGNNENHQGTCPHNEVDER